MPAGQRVLACAIEKGGPHRCWDMWEEEVMEQGSRCSVSQGRRLLGRMWLQGKKESQGQEQPLTGLERRKVMRPQKEGKGQALSEPGWGMSAE